MSQVLIALLDKEDPPNHSFVDGVLASRVPQQLGVRVHLIVSRSGVDHTRRQPRRYRCAVLLPVLRPRRGLGRFINLPLAWAHLRREIAHQRRRGKSVTIFVRNDPLLLLAAKLSKGPAVRLVFQSSFPHEIMAKSAVKRQVARLLYRWKAASVDAIVAVSPLGLERMVQFFPQAQTARWIPLLNDLPRESEPRPAKEGRPVQFVYVGTHHSRRQLGIVLAAACDVIESGLDVEFVLVGGTPEEIADLSIDLRVQRWTDGGRIRFLGKRDRAEIPRLLSQADVGLCVIPEDPVFREASPTKLAEYLAAGLPVLASTGIPLQEQFLRESGAGVLVSFDKQPMGDAMRYFVEHPEQRHEMAGRAAEYGRNVLTYDHYLGSIADLIGADWQGSC